MANKIKKLFVIGSVISGMFLAISACNNGSTKSSSNQENSSSLNDSSSDSQSSLVPEVTLESISVSNNKASYEFGEELNITVTAHYSDETSKNVTGYTVEGFNNRVTGEQNVTVTYEGKTSSFKTLVKDPVLTGINVVNNKTNYEYGEELDITVTAHYSDDTDVPVENYQVQGYNAQNPGEQDIVVTYEGMTKSIKVKVNDPILVSISLDGYKSDYEYGEELDLTVTAHYSDGADVVVDDFTVEGFDNRTPGEHNVVVKYGDKSSSFNVTINKPVLTGINVTNHKDTYEYGEELDLTVTAHYSDDSDVVVTNYEVEGFDNRAPGEQSVVVKFGDQTSTFDVTVNNPVLTGITAVSNKDSYDYGDELDVTVIAHYSDDSTVEVTGYTVEGYNSKVSGLQALTFTYEGKTCNLNISVNERTNRFPVADLNSFLQLQGIKTTIPSPVGYEKWQNKVDMEQDGSNFFVATTHDEGTIGVDSIADQFAVLLQSKGWQVNSFKFNYSASILNGDATLAFYTDNSIFTLRIDPYDEFPTKKITGSLATSKNDIENGEKLVMGSVAKEFVVSSFDDNGYFNTSYSRYSSNGPETIAKTTWRFCLNKVGTYYNILDIHGRKLGATGLGQLAWDEGVTEWAILLTSRSSIIMNTNEEYGRLCFDTNTGKISTYKKSASDETLVYPQLFKLTEVDLIYPTSISLDGRTLIGKGRSNRLTVKTYPSDANAVDNVTWSSSNEAVATVNSSGLIKGVSVGFTTITASLRSKNETLQASLLVEIQEGVQDSWTIMVYMCGSNLEGDSGLGSADIAEILKVSNQPDDVNVIIETGGTNRWHKYNIDANALSRYHVENKQIVLDEKLTKVNMGKQSTFESFLNWGIQEYPADKVGIVLWNHGGALGGVCYDDSVGGSDSLTNSETSAAFRNVFAQNGINKKLEFIGYDACLMQVADIAEFNSHYFNYMVASEESEAGEGWVYNNWIDDVYAYRDTDTILKENCDSFVDKYGSDQTLSYLNLANMADFKNKLESLSAKIKSTVKSNSSTFKSIVSSTKNYGGLYSYGIIDGMDFLNKLKNNSIFKSFSEDIQTVKNAFNSLVSYSRKGSRAGESYGLTLVGAIYVSYPTSETNFTNWRSLFK